MKKRIWGRLLVIGCFLVIAQFATSQIALGADSAACNAAYEKYNQCINSMAYTSDTSGGGCIDLQQACAAACGGTCAPAVSDPGSVMSDPSTSGSDKKSYCDYLPDPAKGKCNACQGGEGAENPTGVWTAIGCLPTDATAATRAVFQLSVGLGGIFVLFNILMGAFGLITSSGNPQAVQKAQDRIKNAVIALLFIVFSTTLLLIITTQILHLPGMTTEQSSGN